LVLLLNPQPKGSTTSLEVSFISGPLPTGILAGVTAAVFVVFCRLWWLLTLLSASRKSLLKSGLLPPATLRPESKGNLWFLVAQARPTSVLV